MKKWLYRTRQIAQRTGALPTSEVEIDDGVVLEADDKVVILNLFDRAARRSWRSKWSKEEVERIHTALGNWLATGRLEGTP